MHGLLVYWVFICLVVRKYNYFKHFLFSFFGERRTRSFEAEDIASQPSTSTDIFMVMPANPSALETSTMRPRPASLRQMPKRRFSTFVSSLEDTLASFNQQQPPIVPLRIKRVHDNIADMQLMPPPKVTKLHPLSTIKIEFDLKTLDLIYVCKYCSTMFDSFEEVRTHWLNVHRKVGGIDSKPQRFVYRVTKKVRCIYCEENVTFYSIRPHMDTNHPKKGYVFGKFTKQPVNGQLQCGVCSETVDDENALTIHFQEKHSATMCCDTKTEPLSILTNETMDALLQQGDKGTLKCDYCSKYFTCRPDFEDHHQQTHSMQEPAYTLQSSDVIRYDCHICCDVFHFEKEAITHIRKNHLPAITYECTICSKTFNHTNMISNHYKLMVCI